MAACDDHSTPFSTLENTEAHFSVRLVALDIVRVRTRRPNRIKKQKIFILAAMDLFGSYVPPDLLRHFIDTYLYKCTQLALRSTCRGFKKLIPPLRYGFVRTPGLVHRTVTRVTGPDIMSEIGTGGFLSLLQWIDFARLRPPLIGAVYYAAAFGHLKMLEWLISRVPFVNFIHQGLVGAAVGDQLAIIRFLLELRTNGIGNTEAKRCVTGLAAGSINPQIVVEHAARHGHLGLLRVLHHEKLTGLPFPESIPNIVIYHGHWNVLEWLNQVGILVSQSDITRALLQKGEGLTPSQAKLLFRYADIDNTRFDTVCCFCSLEVIKWLLVEKVPGGLTPLIHGAAYWHRVDVIQWLHEEGYFIDSISIYETICKCTGRTFTTKQILLLEFLFQQGYYPPPTLKIGHIFSPVEKAITDWFIAHGCTILLGS